MCISSRVDLDVLSRAAWLTPLGVTSLRALSTNAHIIFPRFSVGRWNACLRGDCGKGLANLRPLICDHTLRARSNRTGAVKDVVHLFGAADVPRVDADRTEIGSALKRRLEVFARGYIPAPENSRHLKGAIKRCLKVGYG